MRMMLGLVAIAGGGLAVPAAAAGLERASVFTAVYCCTSPDDLWRIFNVVTTTVGDGVEIVTEDLKPAEQNDVIPIKIDFSADTIRFTYTENATAATGQFNGYRLDFASPVRLLQVSVDPSSTFDPVAVSFNESTIFFNASGRSISEGATTLLTVSAVPEPETWALSALGAVALGLLRHRRNA